MQDFKQIKSYPDYWVHKNGTVHSFKHDKPKILKQHETKGGYSRVQLWHKGKGLLKLVHRLVANAFLVKENCQTEVNHINGVRHDNDVNNLEWCTRSENILHAFNVLGRVSGRRKLKKRQVTFIGHLISRGYNDSQIAVSVGTSRQSIKNIRKRTAYKEMFDTTALKR